MKKNKKFLMSAILTPILMSALFGCGKSDTQDKAEGEVYVPEYHQLAIESDYINNAAVAGDEVFLYSVTYADENDPNSNYGNFIYKYDMLENKAEKLAYEIDENSNVSGMAVNADGNLALVVDHYEYLTDEEGNYTDADYTMELELVSAEDGSVIDSMDITEIFGGAEYVNVQYFNVDAQGNFYLCDGDSTIHIINKDFQKVCDITTDGWILSMATSREGDVYAASYGESGIELKKVDPAGKKLGEAISGFAGGYGNSNFYAGLNKSFLISNSEGLSTYDLSTQTSEDVFNWLDVDINGENIAFTGELSDGRIWAISRDYNGGSASGGPEFELIYLSRKNPSEVTAKEEIIYGTLSLDSDTRKNIIDFNKTNDKYRIKVKEYMSESDYETSLTQFNADMTTGNCPDIIDLSYGDFSQYASKGILEDLYPYMEQSGINQADYLENILKAYEVDGRLYGIMPKFYVSTVLVKSSLVGDASGWTLSENLDFLEEKNPENVFQYGSRDSIFYYCIYNNIDEFINWETGECFFNSQEFIRALEFAAKFPEEPDYSQDDEGIASKLHSDKILLMQHTLSSVQEYQMTNGLFGEKTTYIGYPNSERKGNLIQPVGGSMGMSSKSKHKDGAWEFMKTILSDEFQDSLISEYGGWGFPVKKSALDKQFELDMTPDYYEDEEGNKIENPKTTWGYDDFTMEIMAATQEEIDAVRELIASAEKLSGSLNIQLMNIINEEAEPFFKGQKSASDTAAIIQNRIQIYVNENR